MSASTTSTASHTLCTFRPLACSPRLHQDEERLKSPTKPAPRPSPRSVRFRTKIAIDRCGPSPRPSPAGPLRRRRSRRPSARQQAHAPTIAPANLTRTSATARAQGKQAQRRRAPDRVIPRAGPLRPLTEPQDPSTAAGVFGRACWRSSTSSPGTTRTPSGTSAMRVWVMKDRVSASRLAKARARTGML